MNFIMWWLHGIGALLQVVKRISLRLASLIFGLLAILILGNVLLGSPRNVPYRATDPTSQLCKNVFSEPRDVLSRSAKQLAEPADISRELVAVNVRDEPWRDALTCSIQQHAIFENRRVLTYDLAFLEFQEDGKPYSVRRPCDPNSEVCSTDGCGILLTVQGAANPSDVQATVKLNTSSDIYPRLDHTTFWFSFTDGGTTHKSATRTWPNYSLMPLMPRAFSLIETVRRV